VLFLIGHVCSDCERLLDREFVKALQDQGHSFREVFSIILDMEFHDTSRRNHIVNQAVRQGTIKGYLRFEQDNSGEWHVKLTKLGYRKNRNEGIS
jgi:hypothetical protein